MMLSSLVPALDGALDGAPAGAPAPANSSSAAAAVKSSAKSIKQRMSLFLAEEGLGGNEDEVAVPVAVLGVAQVSALFLLLILLREK